MTSTRPARPMRLLGLHEPMFRNGYALVLNVGLTTALGVLFWIVAAHSYDAADVGRGSALVSALILLANLGQLGLVNGLVRFLPVAGDQAGRLVARSYVLSALLGGALAAGFALLAPQLTSNLAFLHTPLMTLAFAGAVVLWVVFALQDAAMTGLRRAVWVPAENSAYGVLKLAALAPLAAVAPHMGIIAAWVLPVVLLLVPVNLAIFRRWAPQQALLAPPEGPTLPRMGAILRFLGFDYAGQVGYQLATSALPLLVVAVLGASSNGHFYIAWTIAVSLDLLSVNLAQSFTVEAARAPERLPALVRQLLPRMLALMGAVVVVLLAGAPLLMSLYGPGYVAEATAPLRLLALALLARVVVMLSIAIARVRRQVERILAIQVATAVGVLALSFVLARPWGLIGVASAWLMTQVVLAAVLLPSLVRQLRGRDAPLP